MIGRARLDEVAGELLALGTATLYEASREPCFLDHRLRPAWPGAAAVGIALPVRTDAGDNLPLHLALETAEAGDVLVVDGAGAPHGYWGEVMTVAAQTRGVRGLVIDGGVRDTARLEALGFPAFSTSIALAGTRKATAGSVGEPVRLGAVPVRRGDVVVADADGVIVLPAERFDEILSAARSRAEAESGYLARLRAGETTMAVYGFARPPRKDAL